MWPDMIVLFEPYIDESSEQVSKPDNGREPILADRLHLSQGYRLGLVLSVDGIG